MSEDSVSSIGQYLVQEDESESDIISLTEIRQQNKKLLTKPNKRTRIVIEPPKKSTTRYFTDGSGVNETNRRRLETEKSPFVYPADLEEFSHKIMAKAWRNDIRLKELKDSVSKRPSYRGRQKMDLLNRLYVEEPKIETMQTILDVNPVFFKSIGGRPVPDSFNIRDYIQMLRDSLKLQIISGYREDDIMMIEENLLLEQKLIDQVNENYQMYVNAFEDFLFKDHTQSMAILKECEREGRQANDRYTELKQLAKEYGALRSVVYKIEEKWRNCKMYQKFLYLISPISWRKEHDRAYKPDVPIGDVTSDIFGKYRLSFAERGGSLNELINQFMEDSKYDAEPKLFFERPEQLMEVFQFIEMQNLNSLLHSEELAVPLMMVKESMQVAEKNFNKEIKTIKDSINKLEGGIKWEEDRAKYLEDLSHKLLNDEFKNLIMNEDALSLHVFVEDVYEHRIGPNDANLNMSEMMRAIEAKFREELLKLDKLPKEQVHALEGTYYQREMEIMRLAEQAAKQYTEILRITHSLERALEPPYVKAGKELKQRSQPINPPKPPPAQPRDLTKAELQYLDFFTDFCKYTDDLLDYGIDISPGTDASHMEVKDLISASPMVNDPSQQLVATKMELYEEEEDEEDVKYDEDDDDN